MRTRKQIAWKDDIPAKQNGRTERPVPCWQCGKCQKWTPHGRYACQHCSAAQPQYPEMDVLTPDGSRPPPTAQPSRGARATPGDLAQLLRNAGYDDLVEGEGR